jgi:hypothetical protein
MTTFNNISQDFYNNINNFATNPFILVIFILIILVYYVLFAFLGNSNNYDSENNSGSFVLFEALLWGLFIVLIFINGLSYFYGINILTDFDNLFEPQPEIEIQTQDLSGIDMSLNPVMDISLNDKEVFHIPGNKFTYHDAKAICKAFDSELANYEQINKAQENGASWCSYGWTKDRLGTYPTSQNNFLKLKEKEGHEYDCGLPGVNGGYIANPHVKLGANCYGVKPKQSDLEKEYLDESDLYPKTQKELLFEERVKYWKSRLGNVLLMPFNNDKWYKL